MKKLLLTISFVGLVAAPAMSADLARPVYQRPAVVAAPVFSWTGVYLGINGGGGYGTEEYTWNQDATLASVAASLDLTRTSPQTDEAWERADRLAYSSSA